MWYNRKDGKNILLNCPEPEISVDRSDKAPPPIEIEMGPITDNEIKAIFKKF